MMVEPAASEEWERLVVKVGKLALAVGSLELAVIYLICGIVGRTEEEIGISTNADWCKKLVEVAPKSWPDEDRANLKEHVEKIRRLYRRRNKLIHSALAVAVDDLIPGVPAGSVVDLRTFGIGFTERVGNTWTLGVVGERVDFEDIDRLTAEVNEARVGLARYMRLADEIKHPARPFPMPVLGKKL